MTERDDPVPTEPGEADATNGYQPRSGDPALQLFGQGWSPEQEASTTSDSYQGRHRADEA